MRSQLESVYIAKLLWAMEVTGKEIKYGWSEEECSGSTQNTCTRVPELEFTNENAFALKP
jgi:hypothetical protein